MAKTGLSGHVYDRQYQIVHLYLVPQNWYPCGLSVTKFLHAILSRNSAECSISFSVDSLFSIASLTLTIHRFLGLPLGRMVLGFHSIHLCAV